MPYLHSVLSVTYNGYMTKKHYQSGQVLLLTLLVLSVATTVVLSLIGRATTDVAISNQIAESQRAFSAAEAGIEEMLKTGSVAPGINTLSSGATYSVAKTDIGGAVGAFQFPSKTAVGSTETLWLVEHAADGSLIETPTYTSGSIDVCWSSEPTTPAALISVLYKSGASYRVARGAFDPDSIRNATNHFVVPTVTTGGCGAGTGTTYKQTITFANFTPPIVPASDVLILLRLTPLYNETKFAVSSTTVLPLQGNRVESSGFTTGGITRKIVVYQQYRAPASLFDAAVLSGGDFVK